MKRLFLAILVTLLLAAGLASAISYDPGYLLISFGRYTLETTLWVGLLALLVAIAAVVMLWGVVRRVLERSGAMSRWRQHRRQRRGQQEAARGMVAFVEGDFDKARKRFERAARHAAAPLVDYLMAARASAALDDRESAYGYFRAASDSDKSAKLAVALTQAEWQLSAGLLEQALATLSNLDDRNARHPRALRLLSEVTERLGDWQRLQALVPQLRKRAALPAEQIDALECRVWLALLNELGEADEAKLHALSRSLSKPVARDERVVEALARAWALHGHEAEAERLIAAQLERTWSERLIDLYGRLAGDDAARQLRRAEQWLEQRPEDPVLLRCVARLALRNHLWGKAREYFESSMRRAPTAETNADLARLLDHLGEPARAHEVRAQGLAAVAPLPPLPMPGTRYAALGHG